MELSADQLVDDFKRSQAGRATGHSAAVRQKPSIVRYDYLTLSMLSSDITALIGEVPAETSQAFALDIGAGASPYAGVLADSGYAVKTLDIDPGSKPDFVGSAEDTRLPPDSFDLVLCTQVLEHCRRPLAVLEEVRRILRPGGYLIASVPHVWFYHPHPGDYWRFTQQGVVELCQQAGFGLQKLVSQGGSVVTFGQVVCFLAYGLLGRAGAPLYALANSLARVLDPLVRNTLFAHNFAWLSVKPQFDEQSTGVVDPVQ